MKIAVFGLGEAGSLFAADLVAAGVTTSGYDPAKVATPPGVTRHQHPADAVADADAVFALTAAKDAPAALRQALAQIPATALYADFATGSAGLKQELAGIAASRNLAFIDIALISMVPGNGLRTPALASGNGARRFVEMFSPLGMRVEAVSDTAGDAATRKLLRSVVIKGLAALVIEAMNGAHAAGCPDWLWQNLSTELIKADATYLPRLVLGTKTHAIRRLHEMEAATTQLQELGVDPLLTRSTVENLRRIPHEGIPAIPE
jgi:3-hydroxyisobutyrate dehydrogenase-like beta-hydroxyacid dehydrogenase